MLPDKNGPTRWRVLVDSATGVVEPDWERMDAGGDLLVAGRLRAGVRGGVAVSHFEKSWGAEPAGEGRWRFRLWAPGAERMGLVLDGERHEMDKSGDGWFETERAAGADAAYAFAPPEGPEQVPDPAARAQAGDVHGPSRLIDPRAWDWQVDWKGRPWEETVLYELHTGTFSRSGDFDGVRRHLDHLARIGVTAVELCPVAQFSGDRGWGYDGVLLYAPHVAYGGPDGLKRLVDAAHEQDLMVFLDVVYNHFGPDGSYLHAYRVLRRSTRPGGRGSRSRSGRCATSSSRTRSTGSTSIASTGCASTRSTRSPTRRTSRS